MNINIIAIITIIVVTIYVSKNNGNPYGEVQQYIPQYIPQNTNRYADINTSPIILIPISPTHNSIQKSPIEHTESNGTNTERSIENLDDRNIYVNNFMEDTLNNISNIKNKGTIINHKKQNPLYYTNYGFNNNLHTSYMYKNDRAINNNAKLHSINQLYDLNYGVPNKMGDILTNSYNDCHLNRYIYY